MSHKYTVTLERVDSQHIISVRRTIRMRENEVAPLVIEAFTRSVAKGAKPCGPLVSLFHDEEYNPEAVDMEVAVPVADASLADRVLPGAEAATTLHIGPWELVGEAYAALFAWVNENGYRAGGATREVYLVSAADGVPPEQYQTKVIVPVVKG